MQNALKDKRLKFKDKTKPPMKIDANPLQVEEENFIKPIDVKMVEIIETPNSNVESLNMLDYAEKVMVVYQNAEE